MYTYHVYFTPKETITDLEVFEIIKRFGDHEVRENLMMDYALTKFEDKASFPELSDFYFIANYRCKVDQDKAMGSMKNEYGKEPHLSLMKMVKEFRVAFSKSLESEKNSQ